MASLIPPKQPARRGVPKLSLPIGTSVHPAQAPRSDDQSYEQDDPSRADDATIMPFHSHLASNVSSTDQIDELQRVVQRKQIPSDDQADKVKQKNRLSLGSLDASDVSSSEGSSTKPVTRSSVYRESVGGYNMQLSNSEPGAAQSGGAMPLEGNLEVLESLGEGASGEVAKARVKSTGEIVARKVRVALT